VDWIKDFGEYLWVGDFKTSKDMAYVKAMQLLIYVMALEKKIGKVVKEAFYLMLRSGAKIPVNLTEEERYKAMHLLVEADTNIKAGKFEATPHLKVCQECVFRNMCNAAKLVERPKITSFGSASQ
jgi:CRISPR/Cas system-associated exonuclease Cas4 (RecB family)